MYLTLSSCQITKCLICTAARLWHCVTLKPKKWYEKSCWYLYSPFNKRLVLMSFLPWNMCLYQQHKYDISWIKRSIIQWMVCKSYYMFIIDIILRTIQISFYLFVNYIFMKPYVVLKVSQNIAKLKIDMVHIVRSITLNLLRKRKVFWTNIIVMIVPELCTWGKHYFVVEKRNCCCTPLNLGNENDLPEFTISV